MHKEVLRKQTLGTSDVKYPWMRIQERIKHRQCPDWNLQSTIEITWSKRNGAEADSFASNKEKRVRRKDCRKKIKIFDKFSKSLLNFILTSVREISSVLSSFFFFCIRCQVGNKCYSFAFQFLLRLFKLLNRKQQLKLMQFWICKLILICFKFLTLRTLGKLTTAKKNSITTNPATNSRRWLIIEYQQNEWSMNSISITRYIDPIENKWLIKRYKLNNWSQSERLEEK